VDERFVHFGGEHLVIREGLIGRGMTRCVVRSDHGYGAPLL
jgi:hypothetical protein